MRSVWLAVLLAAAPLTVASTRAEAEPTEIGGFFGPRIFSDNSALGYLPDASFHPSLSNSVGLGGRIAKPFGFPWFLPEFELMVVPTKTNMVGGASPATVVWVEPRFHLR